MSCYGWGFKALLFVRVHVYALLYSTISPKVPFLSMKAPVSVTAAGLLGSLSELVGFGMDLIGLTYVFELLGALGLGVVSQGSTPDSSFVYTISFSALMIEISLYSSSEGVKSSWLYLHP